MARKNFLEGLADTPSEPVGVNNYPMRGAGKSLVRTLDELAKQADRFLEGEAVVELDPSEVDVSFVSDRLSDNDAEFKELVEAIRERGQDTPILVRPNTSVEGRYQVVFGHRRLRAARELGRKVRAVIKSVDDRTHVIAQGQENSARANLTFIERALFAGRLEEHGFDRETIMRALSVDKSETSRLLQVVEAVKPDVIVAVGAAPKVGRPRWVAFAEGLKDPAAARRVDKELTSVDFQTADSNGRFERLAAALVATKERTLRKVEDLRTAKGLKLASIERGTKATKITVQSERFAAYLSEKLPELVAEFEIEIQ